ncbi:MAG: DUF4433 domain-containing protein [Desulfobacteraceae bacterium]|nr:DUF4433 domain-containing protein [Desulfobacteraceae bacterium]
MSLNTVTELTLSIEIQKEVNKRDIKYLLHFTHLSNLKGIFSYGLINRQELEDKNMEVGCNDPYRYDNQKNAICCSIMFPNYKMFYKLRTNDYNVKWVVILLKPSILWEKDCAFCVSNAASDDVTCIPIENRKRLCAFNKLFENIDGKPDRANLNLKKSFPTNPQAEVLVFGKIETDYIMETYTADKKTEECLKKKYPKFEFKTSEKAFSYRADWNFWKSC